MMKELMKYLGAGLLVAAVWAIFGEVDWGSSRRESEEGLARAQAAADVRKSREDLKNARTTGEALLAAEDLKDANKKARAAEAR